MATRKIDRFEAPGIAEVGFVLSNTSDSTENETIKVFYLSQSQAAAGTTGVLVGQGGGGASGASVALTLDLATSITAGAWYEVRAFSYDGNGDVVRQVLPNPNTASKILCYVMPIAEEAGA